jgi:hypothetical protein
MASGQTPTTSQRILLEGNRNVQAGHLRSWRKLEAFHQKVQPTVIRFDQIAE